MKDYPDPVLPRKGYIAAVSAYASWGLLPGYWKALVHVAPFAILAHRVIWSSLFLFLFVALKKERIWQNLSFKTLATFATSGLLIGTNWFVYVDAVNTNHVLEASLGYFINPLVNVLLAAVFLKERLTQKEIFATALAFLGVLNLSVALGRLPWISLVLAGTFTLYGIVRRQAKLGALTGLYIETLILFIPASVYLYSTGQAAHFFQMDLTTVLLLVGCGVVTALPLLWFSVAARAIPLAHLGFLQYISPTLQFLFAVLINKEPFSTSKLISFILIWCGLFLFSHELYSKNRNKKRISV